MPRSIQLSSSFGPRCSLPWILRSCCCARRRLPANPAWFEREGIVADRLICFSNRPHLEYLELYHRIDIGLDTFPYNGHTTNLDSFWMGVPVVTLVGNTVVGRAGLVPTNEPWTAGTGGSQRRIQFVRIATELVGDLPRLSKFEAGMRARWLQKSPLMDAAALPAESRRLIEGCGNAGAEGVARFSGIYPTDASGVCLIKD